MKGYSAFPKAPTLLEPHHQVVLCHIQDTRWGGVFLPLRREAVGVFYSSSRLGKSKFKSYIKIVRAVMQYLFFKAVWSFFFFKAYQILEGYLMPNPLYTFNI